MYDVIMASAAILMALVLWACPPAHAAPHESTVQAIDQKAFSIDRILSDLERTVEQDCSGENCRKVYFYWGPGEKIQKIVDSMGSADRLSVRARFFSDCRLILTRVAPYDEIAAKELKNIEKYYFRKGKLIRIVLGGEVQTFPEDQTAYYERTYGIEPKTCRYEGHR
jgi:hypothetical protein